MLKISCSLRIHPILIDKIRSIYMIVSQIDKVMYAVKFLPYQMNLTIHLMNTEIKTFRGALEIVLCFLISTYAVLLLSCFP